MKGDREREKGGTQVDDIFRSNNRWHCQVERGGGRECDQYETREMRGEGKDR